MLGLKFQPSGDLISVRYNMESTQGFPTDTTVFSGRLLFATYATEIVTRNFARNLFQLADKRNSYKSDLGFFCFAEK